MLNGLGLLSSEEKGISFSEINSYMECPQKWHLSYKEKLRKQAYSQSSPMNVGIVVHELLDIALHVYHTHNYDIPLESVYLWMDEQAKNYSQLNKPVATTMEYDGEGGFVEVPNKEFIQWDIDIQNAVSIAKRTIKFLDVPRNWRTVSLNWDGVETPIIEFRFEYPLVEDRTIVGKIDWVAKNLQDGQTYLIDWKTRKTFTDDFELAGEDMNLQLSIYQYVLNSLGVDTFATITYQIKSVVPSIPETTKPSKNVPNGHVSRAKIATTWEIYEAAVIANGENPVDYLDMRDKMQTDSYWFLPVYIMRSKKELSSRWHTVQTIARRMLVDEEHPKYESVRCAYCPFFRVCLYEDRGLDVENLKEVAYTHERRK